MGPTPVIVSNSINPQARGELTVRGLNLLTKMTNEEIIKWHVWPGGNCIGLISSYKHMTQRDLGLERWNLNDIVIQHENTGVSWEWIMIRDSHCHEYFIYHHRCYYTGWQEPPPEMTAAVDRLLKAIILSIQKGIQKRAKSAIKRIQGQWLADQITANKKGKKEDEMENNYRPVDTVCKSCDQPLQQNSTEEVAYCFNVKCPAKATVSSYRCPRCGGWSLHYFLDQSNYKSKFRCDCCGAEMTFIIRTAC